MQDVLNVLSGYLQVSLHFFSEFLQSLIPPKGVSKLQSKSDIQRQLFEHYAIPFMGWDTNRVERAKEALLLFLLHRKRKIQVNKLKSMTETVNESGSTIIKIRNHLDLEVPP